MTDHPRTPELDDREATAASAYLDGAADADERALVESSPRLLAWVEEHRRIQASIADVPPPAVEVRDTAIAAALALFDELHGAPSGDLATAATPAASPPQAPVTSLSHRRRHRSRGLLLGAAAAVVGVLAIGSVALNSTPRDDAATSRGSVETLVAAPGETIAGEANDQMVAGAAPATGSVLASAPLAPALAPAPTIASIDAAADAGGTAVADDPTPFASESAPADTMPRIADEAGLAAFANDALSAADGTSPELRYAASACAGGDLEVVGQALYGAAATAVFVLVDPVERLATAITTDCRQVLANTEL